MNTPTPRESPDPELSRLLQAWRQPKEPAPGFSDAVWRRLRTSAHTTSPSPWSLLLGWIDDRLRVRFALPACLTVLLLAGVVAGSLHGRASSIALTASLQGRYVQSIDPFAGHLR